MNLEQKPVCLVRAPVATRSGYGRGARDLIRQLIEYDKYDVKIISVNWGETPMNALDETNPNDKAILDRIITAPLSRQPELFITVTIPTEFETIGKFNIGVTAGIETTMASAEWIEACNRMDMVITVSEHSKNVFRGSKYQKMGPNQQPMGIVELIKPIEVLHHCVDQTVYHKLEYEAELERSVRDLMADIPEKFCYLFVGHWLRGEFGEDRKNVGLLVKLFLETFKQLKGGIEPPALILKTGSTFSYLDRKEIMNKIDSIKQSVKLEDGQRLPNIYVIVGDLTDKEMNSLYNHPKVKAHITLTKGEGFGLPLLEASVSGKPIIASGWSGHMDFLNAEDAVLVGGELRQIHPSAVWDGVLIRESSWFAPEPQQVANALTAVFFDYETFRKKAHRLGKENFKRFSYEALKKRLIHILETHVPEFPKVMPLKLPTLKKIELPKIEVPASE